MPDVNVIRDINLALVGADNPAVGWTLHFIIGTIIWGILFALLAPMLPGPYWIRGLLFGTGTWVATMLLSVPLAAAVSIVFTAASSAVWPFEGRAGTLSDIGQMTLPITALVLNWIYGAVLGIVYGVLAGRYRDVEPAGTPKPDSAG